MHHSFAFVRALRPSAAATTGGELHVNRRPVRAPPPFPCLPRKRACAPGGGLRPTAERTAWARVRSASRTAYRGRLWVVLNALGASAIPFARSQSSRFGRAAFFGYRDSEDPNASGGWKARYLRKSLADVACGWLRPSADRPVGESKPRQRVRPGRQPRFQCQGRARVCRS
jgi:hypothetical protein